MTCLSGYTKVKYIVDLNLWGFLDAKYIEKDDFTKFAEATKKLYEYQTVGKYKFKLQKMNAPTRWRHLYVEDTPKSLTTSIKLNLDAMEKFAKDLYNFDGDSIDDF